MPSIALGEKNVMKSRKVYCQGHKEAKKSKSECTDE